MAAKPLIAGPVDTVYTCRQHISLMEADMVQQLPAVSAGNTHPLETAMTQQFPSIPAAEVAAVCKICKYHRYTATMVLRTVLEQPPQKQTMEPERMWTSAYEPSVGQPVTLQRQQQQDRASMQEQTASLQQQQEQQQQQQQQDTACMQQQQAAAMQVDSQFDKGDLHSCATDNPGTAMLRF